MKRNQYFHLKMILYAVLVGLISGLGAVFYRWLLSRIAQASQAFLTVSSWKHLIIALIVMFVGAIIVNRLLKWAPLSGGSGIPQIKAELTDKVKANPWPTVTSKIVGGAINNFFGLSLGREGPSIQIGGTLAKWLSRFFKMSDDEKKFMMTAGASAGLSAAFNAPIAGTLFSVEEMYHSFSPFILVPAFISSIIANMLSYYILGLAPTFSFAVETSISLNHYYWIILVGIVGGLVGCLFNVTLDYNQRLFKRFDRYKTWLFFAVFCVSLLLTSYLPEIQGGGHDLIESLVLNPQSFKIILVILVGKLLFTTMSFSTGAQGGIFLPVLVIGAATGVLIHHIALQILTPDLAMVNFLILGMVSVLCAVVRAPFLSILLISEMTSNPSSLMPLAIAAITSYIVSEALRVEPVYEMLYDKLLAKQPQTDVTD